MKIYFIFLLLIITNFSYSYNKQINWTLNIYQDGKRLKINKGRIHLKRKAFKLRLTSRNPIPFAVLNVDVKENRFKEYMNKDITIGSENPNDLFYKYKVYAYDFNKPDYLVIGDYGYHPMHHDLKKRDLTWTELKVTNDLYVYEMQVNEFVDQNNKDNNTTVSKTRFKALYLIFAVDNKEHFVKDSDVKKYKLIFDDNMNS